jgi:hypothetical protein
MPGLLGRALVASRKKSYLGKRHIQQASQGHDKPLLDAKGRDPLGKGCGVIHGPVRLTHVILEGTVGLLEENRLPHGTATAGIGVTVKLNSPQSELLDRSD